MAGRFSQKIEPAYTVALPGPVFEGDFSVESALRKRRSIRKYADEFLSLAGISQLLWSAQGITGPYDAKTSPSAGALYPLEIYLVAAKIEDLAVGIYRYRPQGHKLVCTDSRGRNEEFYYAAFEQECILEAAALIVLTAAYERTTAKYGERGIRYVDMEAGHAAQNIYLQAVALDLGTVTVGAFYDASVKKVLRSEEEPLYIMPVGRLESAASRK